MVRHASGEAWYSDAALAKQAEATALRDRGEKVPLTLLCGLLEPRTQPTDAEKCRCGSDAREGAGGDGRWCGLCLSRGRDDDS